MISLFICGDFCPLSRIAEHISCGDSGRILNDFIPIIANSDYSITNFEYSIGDKSWGIPKVGPVLYGTEATVSFLKGSGFDCVTLANNHFFDCGQKGVLESIKFFKKYHLDYVGGGESQQEASAIFYKTIRDKKIAFINACEHEFSIANATHGGSNPLDIISICQAIKDAKENSDHIIVITHSGVENYQLPTPEMQRKFRFFIESGADIVINHHQHCYSGYEMYNNKYIFYGLGNFCFDEYTPRQPQSWYEGYALKLDIIDGALLPTMIPYVQCKESPTVSILSDDKAFKECIKKLNDIIASPELLQKKFDEYVSSCHPLVTFTPYKWRILKSLYIRNLFPSMLSKKQKLKILNFTRCEAHYEVLQRYLTLYYNNKIQNEK